MSCRPNFKIPYLLVLLLGNVLSFGQSETDSLLQEFNATENQLVKIKCLIEIGDLAYDHNIDSAELVWHQALLISNNTLQSNQEYSETDINFYKSETLERLGRLNDLLGHFEIAIEHLNQCIKLKRELNDSLSLYGTYEELSLAHFHNGDYNIAMHYTTIYLEYYQRIGDKEKIAYTHYDIAYIYLELQEYKKAKESFDKAMLLFVELEDDLQQAYVLSGIAEYYIKIGNWNLAEEEAVRSMILLNQLGEKEEISIPFSLLGRIKIEKEEFDSAKYYLDRSQEIEMGQPDVQTTLENFTFYSLLYSRQKSWSKALDYANELLELARSIEDKPHEKDAYELLYKIYEEKNDFKNAYNYYKKFHDVDNELSLGEGRRMLLQAELEYEIKEQKFQDSVKLENLAKVQESERIAHDAEIKAEKRTNYLLFGGLGIIMIALIGFIRSNRINKRNNKIISGQNRKLTSKATLYKILKVCSSDQSMHIILQEVINELVLVPWFSREKKAYIFTLNETDVFKLSANINCPDASLNQGDMEILELDLIRDKGQPYYHIPIINEDKLLGILKLYVWENHQKTTDEVNFLESIALLLAETLQRDIIEKKLRLAHMENMLKKKEIEQAHMEVSQQNLLLEALNNEITESINYAKRIQEAILPTDEFFDAIFPNHFVIYRPRDIVGGDFYWANEYEDGTRMIVCADCSGHGIPGAFMTMIGRLLLREIVTIGGEHRPDQILDKMDQSLRRILRQTSYDSMQDGMDVSIAVIDDKKKKIHFSSALRPILIKKKDVNQVEKLPDTKFPIGGYFEVEKKFETMTFDMDTVEAFYLYSDGYTDQFGGPRHKKLGTNQFIQFINDALDKGLLQQREALEKGLDDWQGTRDQIDDILVIGVKCG